MLDLTILTAPARIGGLETVTASLAGGLARRGHRVRVLALLGPGPEERCLPFESLPSLGVAVEVLRSPPRHYVAERRWVIDRLAETPGTVLHSHGYHADLVGWLAARATRRPVVSTSHGFTSRGVKNRVYEWLDRQVLARIDGVIAVSSPLRDQLIRAGVAGNRVHLIPNAWPGGAAPFAGVEARAILRLPATGIVVGWVGRLTPEKAPEVFLAAVPQLPAGVVASIVGEGPMRADLVAEAARRGLGSVVQWHGLVPAASRLLTAYDVMALSSWTEGTPMVLLEAMAAGVPIVATAVGGVPDVVSSREAILVPPGDPSALAAGIRRCLEDPESAAARAQAARERVTRNYSAESWLDRHEQVYWSVACR